MRICTMFLLVVCLALFIIFISTCQPERLYRMEYDVRVINGFKNNMSTPLVIWCSSNDEDVMLGGRGLQEGDDFGWRVKINFWGDTRYSCTMKWQDRRRKFDAFKVPRDIHRCSRFKKCSWLVTEDGFYFSNDEVNWKKDFSWSID